MPAAVSTLLAVGAGVLTNVATSGGGLAVAVGLAILVFGWVGFEVWQAITRPAVAPEPQSSLVPLVPLSGSAASIQAEFGPRVPKQLPAEVAHFVARRAELDLLDNLLERRHGVSDGPLVAVLVGMGGVGKTALAVTWAYRALPRFPDGQIYINFRGYDAVSAVLPPQQALDGILKALGVAPERFPDTLDEQQAMFRTLLSGRRMLLLLDNVSTPDQVRPLVPGSAGCVVLVTSRNTVPGLVARDGAERILVAPLAPQDAVELLRSTVGSGRVAAEPVSAKRIVDGCAGLPLALRLAAERIGTHPQLSLAAVAESIFGGADALDALDAGGDAASAVRSVICSSYAALHDDVARLFRLTALHMTADFGIEAAAALANVPHRTAARLLEALTDAYLVEQWAPGRFRSHDLVRLYASELVASTDSVQERNDATDRMLQWYLSKAVAAARLLDGTAGGGPSGGEDGMGWLTAERDNLIAAAELAADTGRDQIAWQLIDGLARFLNHGGMSIKQAIALYGTGLEAARRAGDKLGEAHMLRGWAVRLATAGDHSAAIELSARALAIYRALDHGSAAWTLLNLAEYHRRSGDLAAAVRSGEDGLALHVSTGSLIGQGHALGNLSLIRLSQGRLAEAEDLAQQSLRLHRDARHPFGEGYALTALGLAHYGLDEAQAAIAHLKEALAVRTAINDKRGLAQTLQALVHVELRAGQTDDAARHRQRLDGLLDDLGMEEDRSHNLPFL